MSSAIFSRSAHETAVSQFYRDHFDELRGYLVRKLDCPEAGRDAAQDLFLRLLLRPPQEPIVNPRGFLLRSARNLAIDILRLGKSQPQLVAIEEHQDLIPDAASDPARIAEGRQRLHALAASIGSLPPKCRRVFFMVRFEGLMQSEIAEQLGISIKMVEKHLARAVLELRRHWAH